MRPKCGLLFAVCVGMGILLTFGPSFADDWVGGAGQQISAMEPLTTYEGGAIRVGLANPIRVAYCGNSSGQAQTLHVLFTNGTQESRSSLVVGLYVAYTEGRAVTFLLSSAGCSPDGSPVVVGIHMNN